METYVIRDAYGSTSMTLHGTSSDSEPDSSHVPLLNVHCATTNQHLNNSLDAVNKAYQ